MGSRDTLGAELRANRAVKLRLAGKTYQEIADTPVIKGEPETLYGSAGAAHDAIKRVLMSERVEAGEDVEELRAEILARYNLTLQTATAIMSKGGKETLPAIDRILKIEAERRQLIKGLAVPQKIEQDISMDDDLTKALAELAAIKAASAPPVEESTPEELHTASGDPVETEE